MVTPVPRPGPVLRIRSLGKTYGIGETAVYALRGVNLVIMGNFFRDAIGIVRTTTRLGHG
jgi:hypothetical protein